MKKIILTLTAAVMLTGCTAKNTETPEKSEPSAVTVNAETETTANKEALIITAAENTTHAETVTEAVTETSAVSEEEYESELHTSHIENVPIEEQAALDKLRTKYGKDFTFICRDVQWEYIGVPIPEKLRIYYTLEDDDGRRFMAVGTEDSDEISGDNYAFPLFENELLDHAKDYIRSYTQAGKLWVLYATEKMMPFEAPAELTYEEFFSYFCQQEGKIFADILLPEGTELPEELTSFDGLNSIYLDGFGCPVNLGVYYLPQSDYDSLEDVTYGDIGIDRDHLKGANAEIRVS
ncbi:MAG: membrane lipoprotein lipid attachment site-containing protein [Ruminococcus sp.]|nr:membrane lipoprotein lipid attachment site-containing protein [Ruminococcus sp.]